MAARQSTTVPTDVIKPVIKRNPKFADVYRTIHTFAASKVIKMPVPSDPTLSPEFFTCSKFTDVACMYATSTNWGKRVPCPPYHGGTAGLLASETELTYYVCGAYGCCNTMHTKCYDAYLLKRNISPDQAKGWIINCTGGTAWFTQSLELSTPATQIAYKIDLVQRVLPPRTASEQFKKCNFLDFFPNCERCQGSFCMGELMIMEMRQGQIEPTFNPKGDWEKVVAVYDAFKSKQAGDFSGAPEAVKELGLRISHAQCPLFAEHGLDFRWSARSNHADAVAQLNPQPVAPPEPFVKSEPLETEFESIPDEAEKIFVSMAEKAGVQYCPKVFAFALLKYQGLVASAASDSSMDDSDDEDYDTKGQLWELLAEEALQPEEINEFLNKPDHAKAVPQFIMHEFYHRWGLDGSSAESDGGSKV
ncbi:hypothetical protein BJ508DRAFT_310987 [Ascobolus immersus RN42]|uniref:Uncharacterized protein n=1 Tax=Ascobolus immersus RN42 TaxID=1160509 RepID=A0A3N4HRZ4_ASCIM|nr:hypothetical protein BJ508DRAFT_310987 [Ascobolus immersus RN42]